MRFLPFRPSGNWSGSSHPSSACWPLRVCARSRERLARAQFQRVHRNAIVNVNHIRKMSALSSQRWLITLSNALQLVVSKRQAHNIRQILHW